MTTLSTILQKTYRKLGQLNDSTATGGSTTTVVDTKQAGLFTNPILKGGVMFVVKTDDGLAPNGEFQLINSYANSTQTFNTGTFTAAVQSGDYIAFAGPDFPLYNLISNVNDALQTIGDIPNVDSTSLVLAASQSEYPWPLAWKDVAPYSVAVQRNMYNSVDNQWEEVRGWQFIPPGTVSGQGTLIFPHFFRTGYAIRIILKAVHPDVRAYNDTISDLVNPEMLSVGVAIKALEWYNSSNSGGDKFAIQRLNDLKVQYAQLKTEFSTEKPKKKAKTLPTIAYGTFYYPGDQTIFLRVTN